MTAAVARRQGSRRAGPASADLACAVFAAALLASGCSPPDMAKVTGQITFKRQPVRMATVQFMPQKQPMAGGVTDKHGRFKLTTRRPGDGAFIGTHKVVIVPWLPGAGDDPKESMADVPPANRGDIPGKFRSRESTPLAAEVVAGKANEFTFDLHD